MPRPAALFAAAALTALAALRAPADYPPPRTLGPVEKYGANIQRSMTLLATSTALKRNTIHVLFYGQSISEQEWTRAVADDLRRRFPLTDLVIENRAIPGFTAFYLVKTAEADLYPFYPDLVIFHVYGAPDKYEDIIRRLRERTTADILMANDHVAPRLQETLDEESNPAKIVAPTSEQHSAPWRARVFLPMLAKKYGTDLADVRGLWKQYLHDHNLPPGRLLRDDLHLNDHGNYLMAEIIKAHLRYRPELPDDAWRDRVKTLAVGTDIAWKDGKLVVPFEGNRVDLVCADGTAPAAAVRIDGNKPSAFPELYVPTRAEMANPRGTVPPLLRVQAGKSPVVETWTLKLTVGGADRKQFTFSVSGSVTGEDGEGEVGKRFVSKSGRVVIEADDWNVEFALSRSRNPDAAAVEVRWNVVPLFADEFVVPGRKNPFGDTVVTVAQGLPNGRHTLEVTGGPDTPLAAVRVYRPDLK